MNLTGYMTINGVDAWTDYFAFLCEDKVDDSFNFGELQKPLEMKEYTTVEFRERDGEELPDVLPSPRYKARGCNVVYSCVCFDVIGIQHPPRRIHGSHPCGLGEPESEGIADGIPFLL